MDADEFAKRVKPAKLRSRLVPFWPAIKKLRDQGYSLAQIREFLSNNEVTISIAGLAAFINRQEGRPETANPTAEPVASDEQQKSIPVGEEKEITNKQHEQEQASESIAPSELEFRNALDPKNNTTFEKYDQAASLANRLNKPKGRGS